MVQTSGSIQLDMTRFVREVEELLRPILSWIDEVRPTSGSEDHGIDDAVVDALVRILGSRGQADEVLDAIGQAGYKLVPVPAKINHPHVSEYGDLESFKDWFSQNQSPGMGTSDTGPHTGPTDVGKCPGCGRQSRSYSLGCSSCDRATE
jgi:hypothetical protein